MANAYEYIQAIRDGAHKRLTEKFVRRGLVSGGTVVYAPYAAGEVINIDDVRTAHDGELEYRAGAFGWFRVHDYEAIKVQVPEDEDWTPEELEAFGLESTIIDYATGEGIGYAVVDLARYECIAQWPQGLVAAGDILSDEDLARLDIPADRTVWVEEAD